MDYTRTQKCPRITQNQVDLNQSLNGTLLTFYVGRSMNLASLFENNTREEVAGILNKYTPDLKICGYEEAYESLKNLI